jgi:hypothetical protein
MRVTVFCPWCAEPNTIWVDPSGGSSQTYVEDCQVCCQAWQLTIRFDEDDEPVVTVEPL